MGVKISSDWIPWYSYDKLKEIRKSFGISQCDFYIFCEVFCIKSLKNSSFFSLRYTSLLSLSFGTSISKNGKGFDNLILIQIYRNSFLPSCVVEYRLLRGFDFYWGFIDKRLRYIIPLFYDSTITLHLIVFVYWLVLLFDGFIFN